MSLGNGAFLNAIKPDSNTHKKGRPGFRALKKPSNLSYNICVKGSMWNRRPLHTAAAVSAQHRHRHTHTLTPEGSSAKSAATTTYARHKFCWRRSCFSVRRPLTVNMKSSHLILPSGQHLLSNALSKETSEGSFFSLLLEGRREGDLLPNVSVQLSSDFYANFCRLPVKM